VKIANHENLLRLASFFPSFFSKEIYNFRAINIMRSSNTREKKYYAKEGWKLLFINSYYFQIEFLPLGNLMSENPSLFQT
jgi:hypothetical protein